MSIYTKYLVEADETYTYASYTPAEFLDSIAIEGFFDSDKKQVLLDIFKRYKYYEPENKGKDVKIKDFLKDYANRKQISLNKDEFKVCEAVLAGLLEVTHTHYEFLWKENLDFLSKNDFKNFIAGVAILKDIGLIGGSAVSNMLNLIEEYRADIKEYRADKDKLSK